VIALLTVGGFLLYPDPLINAFLKGRIVSAFRDAYPEYSVRIGTIHYDIHENRIGFDSVSLVSNDSTLSCTIASYTISGIGWAQLLWARGLVPSGFTGTVLQAHGMALTFPRERYAVTCASLRVSVSDSEAVADSVELRPLVDDEEFFAPSKFRKTRLELTIRQLRISGLTCLELLKGKLYRARSARFQDSFIDVLINKDKLPAKDTTRLMMPNEFLGSLVPKVDVDSLFLLNASLSYGERFAVGAMPGLITLDSMQIAVLGLANHGNPNDTTGIVARGYFMKRTPMALRFSVPLSSSEFSLQYSGIVGKMDLRVLNAFLERAEQVRIKSGRLREATFEITVLKGRASGTVRAVYKDFALATINSRTGSENGIFDVIASFVANNLKIRKNNPSGSMAAITIGKVDYERKRDDPFFRYAWFALRSGLGDVVGF
jgi:hypothetical protein